MREGDTPEGASPKGLGWPLHREKKKNLNKNESRKSKPNSENWTILESSYEAWTVVLHRSIIEKSYLPLQFLLERFSERPNQI